VRHVTITWWPHQAGGGGGIQLMAMSKLRPVTGALELHSRTAAELQELRPHVPVQPCIHLTSLRVSFTVAGCCLCRGLVRAAQRHAQPTGGPRAAARPRECCRGRKYCCCECWCLWCQHYQIPAGHPGGSPPAATWSSPGQCECGAGGGAVCRM
jgi:hypothetical protein